MKYISDIQNPENFKALVCQDLKELGLKAPKPKKNKSKEISTPGNGKLFGTALSQTKCYQVEGCGKVPSFLVDAFKILENHLESEGIFRKNGHHIRTKELRQRFERGEQVEDAVVNDLACLVKTFYRELPDPLLTVRLYDAFMKCHELENERDKVAAILLMCHLLPEHHISTLRYTMLFLQKLANHSEHNKMDVANLAVCLGPNLMNASKDKNQVEFKVRNGAQVDIIQYLISNADSIGMVSEDLYQRQTAMAELESDEELEKSEANITDNKASSKRRKKRTGSFQGLMTTLSNSFSQKIRRDQSKAHNQSTISDKSSMSILSLADKSNAGELEGNYEYDFPAEGATPVVIRKRKATEDTVPFSASKKMAIIHNMPQKSTLGGNTPFKTPSHMRTRDCSADPGLLFPATPRMNMDSGLFSPASATKVKRTPSGKSSCFTPKTNKNSVKKKMQKMFRRLSGGKDSQSPGNVMNASDVGARLSGQDYQSIAGAQNLTDLARQRKPRRKTPSSPARLVGDLKSGNREDDGHDDDDDDDDDDADDHHLLLDSSSSSLMSGVSSNPSIASLVRLHGKPDGVRSPATSSEISDMGEDTASTSSCPGALNRSGLKRGKPNTMRSGLPSPAKRRSLERTLTRDQQDDDGEQACGVLTTLDTSPIHSDAAPFSHRHLIADEEPEFHTALHEKDSSGKTQGHNEASDGDAAPQFAMTRQGSTTSIMSVTESDHDRAFINESLLNDLEESEPKQGNDQDGFKIPMAIPKVGPAQSKNPSTTSNSDTSERSFSSVGYNGQGGTSLDRLGQSKSDSQLGNSKSMESIDSGIGSDDGRIVKSMSLQNMEPAETSFPSETAEQGKAPLEEADGRSMKEIQKRRESPLRFPQSQMRRQRGASPIRIPTIFMKADQEQCQRYREMGRAAMRGSPRKPSLPIGTDLVHAGAVQDARHRLTAERAEAQTPCASNAGHTPKRMATESLLSVRGENTEQEMAPATPKIKPMLMKTDITKRVLAVVPPAENTPARKHSRSPIRPVKRLQGTSPKSPGRKRYSNSPRKLNKSAEQRLSPLPKHLGEEEWDV